MKKFTLGLFVLVLLFSVGFVKKASAAEDLTIIKAFSNSADAGGSFNFTISDANGNIYNNSTNMGSSVGFTLSSPGYSKTFSGFQDSVTSQNQHPANNYTITENISSSWNSPSINCGGANIGFDTSTPNSVTFDYTPSAMAPLAQITCTFTNTKKEDLCPNGSMNAATGQCTCDTGYTMNAAGQCVTTDLCPNLPGNQSTVPSGYTADASGVCTQTALDLCTNIAGNQSDASSVPAGYVPNAAGPGVCPCDTNAGYVIDASGQCVLPDIAGEVGKGIAPISNNTGLRSVTIDTNLPNNAIAAVSVDGGKKVNYTVLAGGEIILSLTTAAHTVTLTSKGYDTSLTLKVAAVTTPTVTPTPVTPPTTTTTTTTTTVTTPTTPPGLELNGYVVGSTAPGPKPGFFASIWNWILKFFGFAKSSTSPAPTPSTPKSDLKVRIVVEAPTGTYNPIIAPTGTVISVAPTTPPTIIKCPTPPGPAFLPSTADCSKLNVSSSSIRLTAIPATVIPNATFYQWKDIPVFTSLNTSPISNGCTYTSFASVSTPNITCSMLNNSGTALVSREIQAVYKCNDTFNYNSVTQKCEKPVNQTACLKHYLTSTLYTTNCGIGLTVSRTKHGPNLHAVTISPSGVPSVSSCPNIGGTASPLQTVCPLYYNAYPTTVTLTASTPFSGETFSWGIGACSSFGSNPICTVTFGATPVSVIANYSK